MLILIIISFRGNTQQLTTYSIADLVNESEIFNTDKSIHVYLKTLTPEQKEKSDAYFEGGYRLTLWNFILNLFIVWIFLSIGLSKWIKNIAERIHNKNLQILIFCSYVDSDIFYKNSFIFI